MFWTSRRCDTSYYNTDNATQWIVFTIHAVSRPQNQILVLLEELKEACAVMFSGSHSDENERIRIDVEVKFSSSRYTMDANGFVWPFGTFTWTKSIQKSDSTWIDGYIPWRILSRALAQQCVKPKISASRLIQMSKHFLVNHKANTNDENDQECVKDNTKHELIGDIVHVESAHELVQIAEDAVEMKNSKTDRIVVFISENAQVSNALAMWIQHALNVTQHARSLHGIKVAAVSAESVDRNLVQTRRNDGETQNVSVSFGSNALFVVDHHDNLGEMDAKRDEHQLNVTFDDTWMSRMRKSLNVPVKPKSMHPLTTCFMNLVVSSDVWDAFHRFYQVGKRQQVVSRQYVLSEMILERVIPRFMYRFVMSFGDKKQHFNGDHWELKWIEFLDEIKSGMLMLVSHRNQLLIQPRHMYLSGKVLNIEQKHVHFWRNLFHNTMQPMHWMYTCSEHVHRARISQSIRRNVRFVRETQVLQDSSNSDKNQRSYSNMIDALVVLAKQQDCDDHAAIAEHGISVKLENTLTMSVVTLAFVETALSWLCHVRELDALPPKLVWIVYDNETIHAIESSGIGSSRVHVVRIPGQYQPEGLDFGSEQYWKLMLERSILVRDLVNRNVNVLLLDLDQTWIQSPMHSVKRLVDKDCDIIGALNVNHELMGNFLMLQSSFHTQWILQRVVELFQSNLQTDFSADSRKYIDNDQSLLDMLTQQRVWTVFLKDLLKFKMWPPAAWQHQAQLCILPRNAIVDGTWYDRKHRIHRSLSPLPMVINNNFIVGIDAKTKRAQFHGHWFYNNATNQCITSHAPL